MTPSILLWQQIEMQTQNCIIRWRHFGDLGDGSWLQGVECLQCWNGSEVSASIPLKWAMFEQNRCMGSGISIGVSRASFWRLRGRFLTPGGLGPPMSKWIWNKCFNTFKMSHVWAKSVHGKWYFNSCLQSFILETSRTVPDSWRWGASDVKMDLK